MTLQIRQRETPVNEMRRKRLENPKNPEINQIVRDADSGRARAQITQKHRDVTGELITDRIWELKITTINRIGQMMKIMYKQKQ